VTISRDDLSEMWMPEDAGGQLPISGKCRKWLHIIYRRQPVPA
jgi:hypothetical protein